MRSPAGCRINCGIAPSSALAMYGAAPDRVGKDLRRDEGAGHANGRNVLGQRHPMDELPREDRQTEGVALAGGEEFFNAVHGAVEPRVRLFACLRSVAGQHAPRGI